MVHIRAGLQERSLEMELRDLETLSDSIAEAKSSTAERGKPYYCALISTAATPLPTNFDNEECRLQQANTSSQPSPRPACVQQVSQLAVACLRFEPLILQSSQDWKRGEASISNEDDR